MGYTSYAESYIPDTRVISLGVRIDSLKSKYADIKRKNELNTELYGRLEKEIQELEDQDEYYRGEITISDAAIKVLQKLSDDRNLKARVQLEELVDKALQAVFIGKHYKLRIIEYTHGANIMTRLALVDSSGKERSIKNSNGGGIKQIIAFLCNILLIVFSGKTRLLVIDEKFSELHHAYSRLMSDIVVELAKKNHFQIIFVGHDENLWSNEEVEVLVFNESQEDGIYVSNEITPETLEEIKNSYRNK